MVGVVAVVHEAILKEDLIYENYLTPTPPVHLSGESREGLIVMLLLNSFHIDSSALLHC